MGRIATQSGDGNSVAAVSRSAAGSPTVSVAGLDLAPTSPARTERFATDRPIWPALVAAVVALGALLRLSAVGRLSLHVDEPASVLAAQMVAESGLPVLPSGVLYLQGATLSYFLAPLVWLGLADLANLDAARLVSVAFGTAAVYLTYRLGRVVTGSTTAAVLAATLVALDPLSVEWSAQVRMYAPVQALALVVALLFVAALAPGMVAVTGTRRRPWLLVGLVVAFWAAVFTQVVAGLLWPPMVVVALLVHGRALLGVRRDLAVALACCLVAPLALVGANGLFGAGPGTTPVAAPPFLSFVGNHLLDVRRVVAPDLRAWALLYGGGALAGVVPTLIAVLSGLLAGQFAVAGSCRLRDDGGRSALGSVLALYWGPVLIAGFIAVNPQPRYLLLVQPFGYVLVAAAVALWFERRERARGWATRQATLARLVAVGIALLLLGHLGDGLRALAGAADQGVGADPDHRPALHYVAARHAPGEPILVALPPVAYLTLGDRDELRFLAGPEGRLRTESYTRSLAGGGVVDYWIGMPAIDSVADLCAVLVTRRDAWLVVDQYRLRESFAYAGSLANVIVGATETVFHSRDGAVVRRPVAPSTWTPVAAWHCRGELQAAGLAGP